MASDELKADELEAARLRMKQLVEGLRLKFGPAHAFDMRSGITSTMAHDAFGPELLASYLRDLATAIETDADEFPPIQGHA